MRRWGWRGRAAKDEEKREVGVLNWEKAQRGCLNLEEDGVKSFAAATDAVITAEAAICCGGVGAVFRRRKCCVGKMGGCWLRRMDF